MVRPSNLLSKAEQQMLRWRWMTMLLIGPSTLGLELIEPIRLPKIQTFSRARPWW